METLYVETTVIGNIAGRDHPDPAIAARQRLTRTWWRSLGTRYKPYVSELTISECSDGDPSAASERLGIIRRVEVLTETSDAEILATLLLDHRALPASEPRDALHIALAAVNGIDFLVSWIFKHILNPHLQQKIASTCRGAGFPPPVICTPQQLAESDDTT
ncbi:type II toxin-antitoxin system VapC family toxin [Botrimarina sp.]|uniref:type II toxin-antitoxin system VapC family toxin n=1 Tax=Botrimarina sp. TaxID=2795802 RepID=UPI0032EB4574